MEDNVIWTNGTDRIDSIIAQWKTEAANLAEDMAKDPERTLDGTPWQIADILEHAWRCVTGTREPPDARRLTEAIDGLDPHARDIRRNAIEENDACRGDERDNLEHLALDNPVAFIGTAGLWDGRRTIANVVDMDNIGDLIATSPWNDMEFEAWLIDARDDLRYVGVHRDGVNTCSVRELKPGELIAPNDAMRDVLRRTRPLGPRIRDAYGMSAPKKRSKTANRLADIIIL